VRITHAVSPVINQLQKANIIESGVPGAFKCTESGSEGGKSSAGRGAWAWTHLHHRTLEGFVGHLIILGLVHTCSENAYVIHRLKDRGKVKDLD